MRSQSIRLVFVALAAIMLSHGAAIAQVQQPDPAAAAAEQAAREAAAAAARPRFNPSSYSCTGGLPAGQAIVESTRPGTWQVSAPRTWPGPTRPGETVIIGVRDKFGDASSPNNGRAVTATVILPDGTTRTAQSRLEPNNAVNPLDPSLSAFLAYPWAFTGRDSNAPGVYTVLWESEGAYIACDGWLTSI